MLRWFVLAFVLTGGAPAIAGNASVAPGANVAGRTQADWSRAWWQWAGSFSTHESPVADRTGRHCAAKQEGPVWFLAGTYGTQRTIRHCRIPAGKFLFFPLINYVTMPTSTMSITCKEAIRSAASITDGVSSLVLEVDGVRITGLEAYRQATKTCFDVAALSSTGARLYPSAANGYYVTLKPLSPGKHVLNFGGALPDMLQAVTYNIEVE